LPSREATGYTENAMQSRTYIAIDLKSFYASVECVERGLDPLTTNLVVADESRTEKTICLAVSPSLKACGIPGRARLFEVSRKVREVNALRRTAAGIRNFRGESFDSAALDADPRLAVSYVVAVPRMALYIEYSARIYKTYLNYVAQDDIHAYSIDEVFIDATSYLALYRQSAREFALTIVRAVLEASGITATAGIGPNLYLAKVAMDIMAKKIPPDKDGVRIAELDETGYRRRLWDHRPITDFWRVGRGYAEQLKTIGLRTMGDIARCSVRNEEILYRRFGVNAELLIDHAWGWEPCTIADIRAYRPAARSIGSGQVLPCPYDCDKARVVVREMADELALQLFEKSLATRRLVLMIGYDAGNPAGLGGRRSGELVVNRYGKRVPRPARGTCALERHSSSSGALVAAACGLFDRIADSRLQIRRLSLTAEDVVLAEAIAARPRQLTLFPGDHGGREDAGALRAERKRQRTILEIRRKYGKNAILKGLNFQEGATGQLRHELIGGHKA